MNKNILTNFALTSVVAIAASCQPGPKDGQDVSTKPKDTVAIASKGINTAETGYADINGLKMYYEVYGKGKPIVLLHGSFMTIPLNWSHIISPMAVPTTF